MLSLRNTFSHERNTQGNEKKKKKKRLVTYIDNGICCSDPVAGFSVVFKAIQKKKKKIPNASGRVKIPCMVPCLVPVEVLYSKMKTQADSPVRLG